LRQVNEAISQCLLKSNTSSNLDELRECLREKTPRNQEILSFYVDALLNAKWPKTSASNLHDQLAFALEWKLFIPIHVMHTNAVEKNECDVLHTHTWLNRYTELLAYYRKCVLNLKETHEEKLKTVKLLNKDLDAAGELFELALL
jgi:hypothetical protein